MNPGYWKSLNEFCSQEGDRIELFRTVGSMMNVKISENVRWIDFQC